MLNVIIADDHAVIREGLRRYLGQREITVVAEAASGPEVLLQIEQSACDVLVLDVSLGRCSAFELMISVHAMKPYVRTVLFTMHEHPSYVQAAWRGGAMAYVTKGRPLEELVTAIRYAIKGIRYASPPLDEGMDLPIAGEAKPLSRRQQQILLLRGQGQRAADIGTALGITRKTVAAHEEKILQKLHLQSRHELLQYCVRLNVGRSPLNQAIPSNRNEREGNTARFAL